MVINHSVRSTLDNDINDSRCAVDSCTLCIYICMRTRNVPGLKYKSVHGVIWLHDDPLPDIKTRL